MPTSETDPAAAPKTGEAAQRRKLAKLLAATAEGDRAAFRRLYDLSIRFVFGIVVAVMRDQQLSEEIAQEVYVTIWKRAKTFDDQKGNPLAWMAAIARNRAIDRLRAERARGFVSFTDEVPDMADNKNEAELTVDAITLRRMLEDLRPEFRQALLLSYFRGYTHAELAAVLDVPLGTAKSWVNRGLAALREMLQ
ncbi:sigma-70 family RNA polymerase sigma factor [Leisingera caerulea]|uniref:Sigma-70 family RNA polymerase sigma factor n=1 Tax=Leisingera caerulea TaxID=506591 RepID=A0A9Q9HKU2_LEICA|nr:sigma-70 family RNA polymerase sigma factor [Leisingera caerulea]UWQ55952.1 sigma-70 family RNA polymerase sigma factor [Leisingera caerulea]